MILAGYVILILSGNQATPLTETIYPTETQCEHQIEAMGDIQPRHVLLCGEVMREHYAGKNTWSL